MGILAALLLLAGTVAAQETSVVRPAVSDWRQIGGTSFDAYLASLATGPVERVWYEDGGSRLLARTSYGKILETKDFDTWQEAPAGTRSPARLTDLEEPRGPEPGVKLHMTAAPGVLFAVGRAVYRSDDGGVTWKNLTEFRRESIIGDGLTDLAVSPDNEEEIVVADHFGVWRSVDGGRSWSGSNSGLPNLPVSRILGLPGNGRGVRVLLDGVGEFEWAPGERSAWRPSSSRELRAEIDLRLTLGAKFGEPVLAVAAERDYVYAGGEDGRLWSSMDGGRSWRPFQVDGAGPIQRIFAVTGNPRVALAAVGKGESNIQVLRTTNGGIFWDDLTRDLPDQAAHSITADLATGSVYVATDTGVYFTVADLLGSGPATGWTRVTEGLTSSPVVDVKLDAAGNQLYIAVEGEGVFAVTAPHRLLAPTVVNAADLRAHPASPGVLLSVLGGSVRVARAGSLDAPILATSRGESQIQVPFDVDGDGLSLALVTDGVDGRTRNYSLGLPLVAAAPSIFVDRDGTPMIVDADSGVLLDAMTPARPGDRIQILATGLGKVDPAWPTGLAAPLKDPPSVVAPVRILLDRTPIEATRAILAPGYVGFYLIEFEVPDIVNAGPAELFVEAGGQASNRTRLYLEP